MTAAILAASFAIAVVVLIVRTRRKQPPVGPVPLSAEQRAQQEEARRRGELLCAEGTQQKALQRSGICPGCEGPLAVSLPFDEVTATVRLPNGRLGGGTAYSVTLACSACSFTMVVHHAEWEHDVPPVAVDPPQIWDIQDGDGIIVTATCAGTGYQLDWRRELPASNRAGIVMLARTLFALLSADVSGLGTDERNRWTAEHMAARAGALGLSCVPRADPPVAHSPYR